MKFLIPTSSDILLHFHRTSWHIRGSRNLHKNSSCYWSEVGHLTSSESSDWSELNHVIRCEAPDWLVSRHVVSDPACVCVCYVGPTAPLSLAVKLIYLTRGQLLCGSRSFSLCSAKCMLKQEACDLSSKEIEVFSGPTFKEFVTFKVFFNYTG